MASRIPYGNDWLLSYTLYNATGSAVAPTTIALALTNANGSAVTLAASVTTSGTVNYQEIASTECTSSAYGTRWTATWTGTYGGADFTDVESLIIVKPGQEYWLTTLCEVKELLGITDSTDDDDVAFLIEQAVDALTTLYDLPTGQCRPATVADQIDAIRLGNALDGVKAVCSPFICGGA